MDTKKIFKGNARNVICSKENVYLYVLITLKKMMRWNSVSKLNWNFNVIK